MGMTNITNLANRQQIEQFIQQGVTLLVLTSPTCQPCKRIKENILPRIESDLPIAIVDATTLTDLDLQWLNLLKVPTLILFKDGVEIKRHIGAMEWLDASQWLHYV